MATVTTVARSGGVVNSWTANFTSDGSAQTLVPGFKPNVIEVWNETDATIWRWSSASSATKSMKQVTGGTLTTDTGSAIVVNSDNTVTLSATLVGTSKVCVVVAYA